MKYIISIPDDVGRFLQSNPKAGRVKIQEEFIDMPMHTARTYAAIGKFMHAVKDDTSEESILLGEAGIKLQKSIDPEKSAEIKAVMYTPADYVDEDSIVALTIKESGMNKDHWFPSKIRVGKWGTGMKMREFKDVETQDGRTKPMVCGEHAEKVTQWTVDITFTYNSKAPLYDSIRALADTVPPLAEPITLKSILTPDNKVAAIIEIADVHFGKLACNAETLLGNMDLPIAVKLFDETADVLLEKVARHAPAHIYIIIGHDLLHYENLQGMTTRGGHLLDTDSRLPKVFVAAEMCLIRLFDKAVQIAPTTGLWIEGNHDSIASFLIARILNQRYELTKHVNIDCGMSPMKRVLWGKTLIGFTHNVAGAKMQRAVGYFKDVFREEYAQCMWSELHAGHLHKANTKMPDQLQTIGRTKLRIVSALSTVDRWHLENYFTDAVPGAEAFIIHKEDGVTDNIIKNINYFREEFK